MFHQSLHQLDGRPAGISVQLTFEKALVLILSWHLKLVLGRTLVSEPFFFLSRIRFPYIVAQILGEQHAHII